ncbi:MAG: hypothetical protein A3C15_03205 [Candidatus Magasanikbacteria bacterium RIFCSPHIGHO2_02_FULL_50_9b]|uniref:Cytochrome b5 heme-binding domain-containing protein n=1 Tax=Candidatus Magasanikbacteria bacterium RIFCSPHIGHO2_02_FULL_50_9b TaxID=1798682 RepID=A0A1F6M7F6_9BACT|nr:MAG: hypothetical protein A3C15_03205 [Candidatus Magasanikbacteria bacterium RIFCSPHIGHO2_02_FULL_50_9b]
MDRKTIALGALSVCVIVAAVLYSQNKQQPTTSAETQTQKEFKLPEIATHKDKNSCWTVIDGGVYDITPFISLHAGGESAILKLCGADGSESFNRKHAGVTYALKKLGTFRIGVLME